MAVTEDLTGAVRASLIDLAEHCAALPVAAYTEAVPELAGASIGQHVRHCLDHFSTFADGLAEGRFDYDARARSADLERDNACAARVARQLADRLQSSLVDADLARPVMVRTASSREGDVPWQRSSVGRELQFLVSHTVHHAAMVAASCRARGLQVADDHGVAPSTLRYRASLR
ncbi:MAG TPA: DinB family protein [bacterium]|nr:DinB family protein [bacterium]